MVNLFRGFLNAFCSALYFHMRSLSAKQQKAQHSEKRTATTSNSSVVGALRCCLGCCLALWLFALGVYPLLPVCVYTFFNCLQSVFILSSIVCICWRFLHSHDRHDTSSWLRRYPDRVLWTREKEKKKKWSCDSFSTNISLSNPLTLTSNSV